MTESVATDLKVIVFQLKDKEYAVPVQQVRAIEKVEHITRVPRVAPFVKGVINLRGVVTPIIDLRVRFGILNTEISDTTRVIIVSLGEIEVGLIVDAANDVIDIATSSIEPTPDVVGVAEVDYINGVAKIDKRLLILLNLEKVLAGEDLNAETKVEGN